MNPIHISEINLKQGGPLENHFKIQCKGFNLIYGLNESGKTYVVEGLLKWLFGQRLAGSFGCRAGLDHAGWVKVLGLESDPEKPVKFQRTGKLSQRFGPLIREGESLAKLLVVRAGQSPISEDSNGVGEECLQEYLSELGILGKVKEQVHFSDSNMSTLELVHSEKGYIIDGNGAIKNPWIGKKKKRDALLEEKEENDNYSEYEINQLDQEIEKLEKNLEILEKAKRHHAWNLFQGITDVEASKGRLPGNNKLNQLRDSVGERKGLLKLKKNLEKNMGEIAAEAKVADRLEKLGTRYEKLTQDEDGKRPLGPMIFMGLAFLATVILGLMGLKWGIMAGALSWILGMAWLIKSFFESVPLNLEQESELEGIREEFREIYPTTRFIGAVSLVVPDPDPRIDRDNWKTQLDTVIENVDGLTRRIDEGFVSCELEVDSTNEDDSTGKYLGAIQAKRDERTELDNELLRLQGKLGLTGVGESSYLDENPGVEWNLDEKEKLEEELEMLRAKLKTVRENNPVGWEDRIKEKEEEVRKALKEYKQHTAELLAKICVWDCVRKREDEEWETIRENLDDPCLSDELTSMTGGHILRFSLGEDETGARNLLIQNTESEEFPMEDVSTGVQEQSLLALRIGFARRKLGDRAAFLILDDAFQHADWQRRPEMIRSVLRLIKDHNWQVFYFTMDNHIRKTFTSEADDILGSGQWNHIEL